jgi:hypothetical protein
VTGRGRRVRFPSAGVVSEAPESVPALGPIVFVLTFEGVERTIDLSDLACPRLVRPLAAALADIGGDDATVRRWSPGFQQMVRHLRTFVTYAAASTPAGAAELDLAGMTPVLLDGFEADLSARHGHGTKLVQAFMSTVVRLLRLACEQHPQAFSAAMAGRLGYITSTPRGAATPLDAYPEPVLEAIQAAAVADVRKIRDRVHAGWRMATAGADPRVAGWSRRENVLWHISVHGPLTGPQSRHVRAVQKAPGGIRALNAELFLTPQDLVPLLVALICCTGLEPECAKDLRADCLSSPARGFVTIAYDKKRARPHTAKTMRVRDGASVRTPGGLLRLAARLSAHARQTIGSDALWVGVREGGGLRAFFDTGHETGHFLPMWMATHGLDGLTDHGGRPVSLDLRRLRKSYKSRHYQRVGGVLDDFTAGHTKQVAAAHYADIGAHREIHDQAVEAGLRQALAVALPPPVVADQITGEPLAPTVTVAQPLTPIQAAAAISSQADVFLASCTDFNSSPFARSQGSPCPVPVWGCLECPNAVFTERHLPSLLSFADFLQTQREVLPAPSWDARHGLGHERLTAGILPAFSQAQLEHARSVAADGSDDALPAALPTRLLEQLT